MTSLRISRNQLLVRRVCLNIAGSLLQKLKNYFTEDEFWPCGELLSWYRENLFSQTYPPTRESVTIYLLSSRKRQCLSWSEWNSFHSLCGLGWCHCGKSGLWLIFVSIAGDKSTEKEIIVSCALVEECVGKLSSFTSYDKRFPVPNKQL